jgi:eukaryotic-like serine/threonine-protein kinase
MEAFDPASARTWVGGRAGRVADQLVEALAAGWREGRRPRAEEVLGAHPELRADREVVLRLLVEEMCLRKEAGESVSGAELLDRFPQWADEVRLLLECQRLFESGLSRPEFPKAGERLGDFRLLAELGRGARGCVYLATQPSLADRPVVLKLTALEGQEHLTLARLQHAHIVPLYFATAWPECHLQGLCMPYLGGLTLGRLLRRLAEVPPGERTGRHVLEALEEARPAAERLSESASLPAPASPRGPVRRFLAGASFARGVCWLGACLADALQYAHECGLVHLDLKPDNVLLAADGQPMLLDFHLARTPLGPGEPAHGRVGGTPGYMAPEQEEAVAAAWAGETVPAAVDRRADVYALGMLLYGALGGETPVPGSGVVRALKRNPQVSTGLADVVARCLEADPGRRYPEAGLLAADLRLHLADRPLEGVRNRDLRERWRKWRRRRGRAGFPVGLALAALLAAGAAGAGLAYRGQEVRQARAELAEGRRQLGEGRHAEAARSFARARARLRHLPGTGALADELGEGLRAAERGVRADELHELAERLRLLYGAEAPPSAGGKDLGERCRACWEGRGRLAGEGGEFDARARRDLLDLAVLWSALRVRQAPAGAAPAARREALRLLAEAEESFGPSPVLELERAAHARALGVSAPRGAAGLPRTSWEHYAVGRSLLGAGRLGEARAELGRAVEGRPQDFWAQFYYGLCCYRAGKYAEALAGFHACVALAPDSAACLYNRALAFAALGRDERAVRDYDEVLRREPRWANAALNRGLLHYRAGRHEKALADFRRALASGPPAPAQYALALAYRARGQTAEALACLREALRHEPGHKGAAELYRQLSAAAPAPAPPPGGGRPPG